MIRALVIKELRETAKITVAVLVLGLAYIGALTGSPLVRWIPDMAFDRPIVPFVGGSLLGVFAMYATFVALLLGFWQSVTELARGTAPFLFHRPLSRRRILLTKLATGIALYFVCTAVPILVYAWWAATPGTHAGPFFWSMLIPYVFLLLTGPAVYLGAFASGWRDGRWFGSRLLPLFGAGFLGLMSFIHAVTGLYEWWPWLLPLIGLCHAWLIGVILTEARMRDL